MRVGSPGAGLDGEPRRNKGCRCREQIGDVGAAIQEAARRFGCTVIEDYVGHGIGRALHEDPMVLNFGTADTGLRIVPGMVFTVEPMLNLGRRRRARLQRRLDPGDYRRQPLRPVRAHPRGIQGLYGGSHLLPRRPFRLPRLSPIPAIAAALEVQTARRSHTARIDTCLHR